MAKTDYIKFKQTEIGLIPEDWEVVRLGDVVTESLSGDWGAASPQWDDYVECLLIRGTDFPKVQRSDFSNVPIRFVKGFSFIKRKLIVGDLLIEISGGSKDQPTGRILLITPEFLGEKRLTILFSNFVKRMHTKSCVDPEYLFQTWGYLYERGKTQLYEKRTTNIRNFKLSEFLRSESIPLPPPPEQRKIARVLSTIQRAIEQQDKIIEATKKLKKSLMHKLFTEGLNGEEQKETEIGLIPKSWELKRLKDIATLQRGKDLPKQKQIPGIYPIVGSNGIIGYHKERIRLWWPRNSHRSKWNDRQDDICR